MAAVGGNNVYVDIIFRLQAEAAKKAEQIIGRLIKKGQLATAALQQFKFPDKFPRSTAEATSQLFKFAQKANGATRATSDLWKEAIKPLTQEFALEEEILRKRAALYSRAASMTWEEIRADEQLFNEIKRLGANQENYQQILTQQAAAYSKAADKYKIYREDLEKGGRLLREELANQRRLWRIYQTTGVRLEGLDERLIKYARTLDSTLPLSERTWRPMERDLRALATGLNAFNKEAANNFMIMARNAAAAEAFQEPVAQIDRTAARLLRTISPLNYQLAKMGITQAITSSLSKELARGQAEIAQETINQARAIAETAACFDRLNLPLSRNLNLGARLYDIFSGNARAAIELEDSIKEATGITGRFSRGLHLINRALRAQNVNFEINYDTLKKITKEGWAAFTEEQRKALLAIRDSYNLERKFGGALSSHERALLRLINTIDEYDRALHFELRTARDAEFLLRRLKTVGYDGLTEAEKKAIEVARERLALTWDMDERMRRTLKKVIDLRDAYTSQNQIFGKLTARQQMFLIGINRLRGGLARLSRFIDRVSIGSLKLLGPLFLASAAFNTIGRIVGACVSAFTEYEDKLIDLRIAGELSVTNVNKLSQAFISLERILPVSAAQMAEIATLAAKAGITGAEQIKAFTLAIVKFTKVTGWSAEEASNALLRISQAFSLPIENAEKLASMMHHLAVVSVADAEDIVKAMARIGAAATNLEITADMAAAMATTLIDAGMGAERAGTRLRAFFREFLEKSEKIAEVMERGASIKDFAELMKREPARALMLFLEYLRNIPSEVERSRIIYSIFGSVASFAIITLVEHYDELMKRMQEANRELTYGARLTQDFSIWMDAASTSIRKAENSINRLTRAIGAGLAPVVSTVADKFANMLESMLRINTEIQITTRGTQEWINIFEKSYPLIDEFTRGLTLAWQIGRLAYGPFKDESAAARAAVQQLNNEWQSYVENVAAGGDIVFGYAGRVLEILEKVGGRTETINELESEHRQIQQDLNKAFKIRNYLETRYGRETLQNIAEKIRFGEELTEQEERLRDEAGAYIRINRFIAWATARREFIEKRLIDVIAQEARLAIQRRELQGEDLAILNDYLKLYNAYESAQTRVNRAEAIGLALLSKYGPLYADLKRNIDPETLARWTNELESAAKAGKPLAPIIGKIIYELETAGYALYLGADGWRLWRRGAENVIPTGEEITRMFDQIIKSSEELKRATPEEFFDSLAEGWNAVEKFMGATASAARAKVELDKTLRFTAPGILFRREFGKQIDIIYDLMATYEEAVRSGNAMLAAEKEQALMAELLTLQQRVLNSIQLESSIVLREQKLAWLDIVETMFRWVEGVTSNVPQAARALSEWENKFSEIQNKTSETFQTLSSTIDNIIKQFTALTPSVAGVSETAAQAAPNMQTFGSSLNNVAIQASNANTQLNLLPNTIAEAANAARANPINITTDTKAAEEAINKFIESQQNKTISIPVTLTFLVPPLINLAWSAIIRGLGKILKTVTGSIGLSIELARPRVGARQYGGEIKRTGEYLLHRGEYVLPSRDLQRLIDALYLIIRREERAEFGEQRIYNIRIEGEPTPGIARFIRELEYIS